jgi:hypothetical protein
MANGPVPPKKRSRSSSSSGSKKKSSSSGSKKKKLSKHDEISRCTDEEVLWGLWGTGENFSKAQRHAFIRRLNAVSKSQFDLSTTTAIDLNVARNLMLQKSNQ